MDSPSVAFVGSCELISAFWIGRGFHGFTLSNEEVMDVVRRLASGQEDGCAPELVAFPAAGVFLFIALRHGLGRPERAKPARPPEGEGFALR